MKLLTAEEEAGLLVSVVGLVVILCWTNTRRTLMLKYFLFLHTIHTQRKYHGLLGLVQSHFLNNQQDMGDGLVVSLGWPQIITEAEMALGQGWTVTKYIYYWTQVFFSSICTFPDYTSFRNVLYCVHYIWNTNNVLLTPLLSLTSRASWPYLKSMLEVFEMKNDS